MSGMWWCVTVEIHGEPARVVGPFRSELKAGFALDALVDELPEEDVAASVQMMTPPVDWREAIPWMTSGSES